MVALNSKGRQFGCIESVLRTSLSGDSVTLLDIIPRIIDCVGSQFGETAFFAMHDLGCFRFM